jgi:tetratricopeptide (TPR) repeat protein
MGCPDDDTIAGFIDGRLSPAELVVVESHVRACVSCEELISAGLAAAPASGGDSAPPAPADGAGPIARGTSVGRYTVLALVGHGGMGEVFAAYDPRLDRKIALKLLRAGASGGSARGEGRLLREAQAIAQLSHPNVITVHDVGTYGDRVFLAMEYVDGHTLSTFLAERTRTRAEILSVFQGAARGLAAAHAAGLVHRDFKPQNVMVGRDGTARVMDFGLARRIDGGGEAPSREGGAGPGMDAADVTLTQTGELIGTPLYMAPEQFKAEATDPRTDQFSFCITLYQALYGEHPFLDLTRGTQGRLGELVSAVVSGRVRPAPARTTVPGSIRRALLRGLSVAPEARWPSIDDLMAALGHDPARRRRRLAAIGAAALALAGVVVGVGRASRVPAALCQGGPARLADAWQPPGIAASTDPRRDRLRTAFLATGVPDAPETWDRVATFLDRYATSWLATYRDACEATQVRGEQSAEVLDLRMGCLEERHGALRALTDVLASADSNTVANAVDAADALPALDRCSDVKLLRAGVEPPRDARARAQVDDIRRRAATAKALGDIGRQAEALAQGRALLAEARGVGYLPLIAELLTLVGSQQEDIHFRPEAVKELEQAVWTALRGKRDDIAAEAAAYLAGELGYSLDRREDGERWADLAEALIDRMGQGHERLRSWLLQDRGVFREKSNELDEGLLLVRQAVALKRKLLPPDHPDIGRSLQSEANFLHLQGDFTAALKVNDEAIRIFTSAYGPRSAKTASAVSNGAEYEVGLGRAAEALPHFREALPVLEAQLGADNQVLGHPLTGLGHALLALGQMGEARATLERAMRIRDAREPDPVLRGETRFALAQALWATDQGDRARELAEKARQEYQQAGRRDADVQTISRWLEEHPASKKGPPQRARP